MNKPNKRPTGGCCFVTPKTIGAWDYRMGHYIAYEATKQCPDSIFVWTESKEMDNTADDPRWRAAISAAINEVLSGKYGSAEPPDTADVSTESVVEAPGPCAAIRAVGSPGTGDTR